MLFVKMAVLDPISTSSGTEHALINIIMAVFHDKLKHVWTVTGAPLAIASEEVRILLHEQLVTIITTANLPLLNTPRRYEQIVIHFE